MRIAYIYDVVYPWKTGGIQKRMWEIGRRLADRHDIHWYGLKYWDGPPVIEKNGITHHGVMDPPELYTDGRRSIKEALAFSARLLGPLSKTTFDLVHCQEFPYFPVFPSKLHSTFRRTPLVMTWHEVWGNYWYDYLGRKGIFGKAVERTAARLPDAHVAVSRRTSDDLRTLGVGRPTLIPNGIEMTEIEAAPPAERPVDVLFVGRLTQNKGVHLLLDAVDILRSTNPDIQCTVVGDGPERTQLEARVHDRGLESNVTLVGRMSEYEEVLGLMKAASAFVLPSRREGFGISALEALACGTPVVTIEHPQNAATDLIVTGETGRICPANPEAIAEAVRQIQSDTPVNACTAFAREYGWGRIALRTEELYEDIVSGGGRVYHGPAIGDSEPLL